MKSLFVLIFCIMMTGCASQQQVKVDSQQPRAAIKPVYTSNPAGALVFQPPVSMNTPQIDLSRENRSPAAFYGYVQSTVDNYLLYQRDDFRSDGTPSRFERDARFTRSSVTYR